MNRRAVLVVTLWALGAVAQAETTAVGNLRGLNNADSSMLINDNEAQDLLNVDITDNGYGIKKRGGYTQFKTIGTSTWGVRGGYYFRDASGNNNLVHANNRSVFKSVNSGAYAAFITTDTAGSYYDFTDSQGYLYRATSNRDEFIRYDGTTLTYYPSAPKGTQIEAMPDRMVIAGTSADPNRVYFSKTGDFTDYTIGGLTETDPFYEDFGLPGQSITAVKYFQGRLLVWTKSTLSFWAGTNQYDGIIENISTNIGTVQPYMVQENAGTVSFQGQDGHFYEYDGNSLVDISRAIVGSVTDFSKGGSSIIIQTTQSDFEAGTVTKELTASEVSGSVAFVQNGDIPIGQVWGTTKSASFDMVDVYANTPAVFMYSSTVDTTGLVYTTTSLTSGGSIKFDMFTDDTKGYFYVYVCTGTAPDLTSAAGCYRAVLYNGSSTNNVSIQKNVTPIGSPVSVSNPVESSVKSFEFRINSGGNLSIYKQGAQLISVNDTDLTAFAYIGFGYTKKDTGSTQFLVDEISIHYGTGTFTSAPLPLSSSISSWGRFEAGNSISGNATISYAVYSDTDTTIDVTDSSSFVSSQTITSGSIMSLATGTYITYGAAFARTSSTESPSLDSILLEYYTGNFVYGYVVQDKDYRLVWSLSENAGSTPNATYIYDRRFDTWIKYDIPMSAPVLLDDLIYFGGPSTGVVYAFPSGTNDDGAAIMAYWKSKDFIGNDPFVEKNWLKYSVIGKTYTGSNLDISYSANTLTATTENFSLSDANNISLKRINANFPAGTMGTFFNMQFGNDDADAPFEIYTFRLDYTPRPWRVLP